MAHPFRSHDPLVSQAHAGMRLVARHRDLDPVVPFAGLGLQPALQAYLCSRDNGSTGEDCTGADARAAARRAGSQQLLRTRIELWATLLQRDIPGYLDGLPAPRGAARDSALRDRAARMIALVQARGAAGRPLPYGAQLGADLQGALRGVDAPLALARQTLRRELDTLRRLLHTLLGPDHPDLLALRAPARTPADGATAPGQASTAGAPPAAPARDACAAPMRRAG